MPSDVYITLSATSWGDWDDGNRYVAPEDGYIMVGATVAKSVFLQCKDSLNSIVYAQGYPTTCVCVRKGVQCRWDVSDYAKFYYSIKSAKKLGLL